MAHLNSIEPSPRRRARASSPGRARKRPRMVESPQYEILESSDSTQIRSETPTDRAAEPNSNEQLRSKSVDQQHAAGDKHRILLAIDIGGSSIKAVKSDSRTPREEFIKGYSGGELAESEKQFAPSRLYFEGERAIVGFDAFAKTSSCIADLKRLSTCDRNEGADIQVQSELARQLGKSDDDVEIEDWYSHFIDYILAAVTAEGYFAGEPAVRVILTSMSGTPDVYHGFMKDIVSNAFQKIPCTLEQVDIVSEPQAALRKLSYDSVARGDYKESQMVILVDIGGTSVDFIAGTYNAKLNALQSRYCPLSLVYGGVDIERTGIDIALRYLDGDQALELSVRKRMHGSMARLIVSRLDVRNDDKFKEIIEELCSTLRIPNERFASAVQTLSVELSAAIDEHRDKITDFVARQTVSSLARIDASERKQGVVVHLVGGGAIGLQTCLRSAIESQLLNAGLPNSSFDVKKAVQSVREVVPIGAMKILQDLVFDNKGSRYKNNYCIRRYVEGSVNEREIKPQILLRKGDLYFPDQEFVHLMMEWSKNGEGDPALPSKLPIHAYSENQLQIVDRWIRAKGKSKEILAQAAKEAGVLLGEIEVKCKDIEDYMYTRNVPSGRKNDNSLGTRLEYQLILSVGSNGVKARLRLAQMDAKLVPAGKPRCIELGSMESTKSTGED